MNEIEEEQHQYHIVNSFAIIKNDICKTIVRMISEIDLV